MTTKNTLKSAFLRKSHRSVMLPTIGHIIELSVAIVIFASGQNIWGAIVRADGDNDPPTVPTGLSVTSQSASEIDITWTASTGTNGVAGYNVYRNGAKVGSSLDTSYDDTGLTPNTSYDYTVTAFDSSDNESAESASLNSSTLADTSPPSTPTNLHETDQTTSTITIAWNSSSDNVGVAGYNVYRNGALVSTQVSDTFKDTGLAVFSNYDYTVTAFDAAGNISNLSATLVASTSRDTTPPSTPDNISETSSTVSSITIEWDASTDDVGVAGYNVYRNGSLINTQGGTSFTDTGLTFSSNYTYTVSAFDAAGNTSAQSAPFFAASSSDTTPPTIPGNLKTTQVLDDSISLSWDASTDNVDVAGYKIYRNNGLVGTSTTTSFTDTGLNPVTDYDYVIEAYDESNNVSASSATLSTETAFDTTPPSTPNNMTSSSQTDTTISLSWNAATDNIGVTGYNIYRNGVLITSTTGTSYVDSGLNVSTAYIYQVQAYDASANDSTLSAPLNVSTIADLVAPSAPSNLTSTNQTITTISLQWDSSTDDVQVASYNIYRNGILIANVSGTTYTDSSLNYGTSFSYKVTAVDEADNESEASNILTVSTLPDTIPPVISLTTPTNNQTTNLTFPISATASDQFGVSEVQFYADTTLISTITSAPYTFNWDSYAVHNGAHTITAVATDVAGNQATQSITINIDNPPPPIEGDLNGDHKVNILDLSILLSNWNKSGLGDFENTGHVGIFDLSILLSHYGQDDSNYN
jgi:chitodextrinase